METSASAIHAIPSFRVRFEPERPKSKAGSVTSRLPFPSTDKYHKTLSLRRPLQPLTTSSSLRTRGAFPREQEEPEYRSSVEDEFTILHPVVDDFHDNGAAVQAMFAKWAMGPDESQFSSIAVYCEMKLQEAKRITSRIALPNRFLTCACIRLLNKLGRKLGATGHLLNQLTADLIRSIYHLPEPREAIRKVVENLDTFLPYFVECEALKRENAKLRTEKHEREKAAKLAREKNAQYHDAHLRSARKWQKPLMFQAFRQWAASIARKKRIAQAFARNFVQRNVITVKDVFRVWRIESLRRGYRREAQDYQTMLSVTTQSLNRKNITIENSEGRIEELELECKELREANTELQDRVQELELQLRNALRGGGMSHSGGRKASNFVLEIDTYDHPDEMAEFESPKESLMNKMLLEALFGMARMVETVSIQAAKEVIEILESHEDTSYLFQIHKAMLARDGGHEASTIERKFQSFHDLKHLRIDKFLLDWAKLQLKQAYDANLSHFDSIQNFGSDLKDGRRYCGLLRYMFPDAFHDSMAFEIEESVRLQNVVNFTKTLDPPLSNLLSVDTISSGDVLTNLTFIAILFAKRCSNRPKYCMKKPREALATTIGSWKMARRHLLTVKRQQDPGALKDFLKELQACNTFMKTLRAECHTLSRSSTESALISATVHGKILEFTWNNLALKLRGQIVELVDEKADELTSVYFDLSLAKLRDFLMKGLDSAKKNDKPQHQVLEQHKRICNILKTNSRDLHSIFQHYSAGPTGGSSTSMNFTEFMRCIKDCQVLDKKLTVSIVDLVFQQTMLERMKANPSDKEMGPREFSEGLLRLAEKKCTQADLSDRLEELLVKHILPNAQRSQSDKFRADLESAEITAVFRKHKVNLQRAFRYYATLNSSDHHQTTIDVKAFLTLVKDCRLAGAILSDFKIRQIFANIQHSDANNISEEADMQADFAEFQEALAVLTGYFECNPYVPLYIRLDQFLTETFIPRARQKKK